MKEAHIMKECGAQLYRVATEARLENDCQRAIDNYVRAALAYEDAASVFERFEVTGQASVCNREARRCRMLAAKEGQRRNRA